MGVETGAIYARYEKSDGPSAATCRLTRAAVGLKINKIKNPDLDSGEEAGAWCGQSPVQLERNGFSTRALGISTSTP